MPRVGVGEGVAVAAVAAAVGEAVASAVSNVSAGHERFELCPDAQRNAGVLSV